MPSSDLDRVREQVARAKARRFRQIAWAAVSLPALGVAAAIALAVAGYPPGLIELSLLALFYAASLIGIEVGFHRYFSHRAFQTKPWIESALAAMGSMSFQGPVIWWAATHRRHHAHTDAEDDPHSPQAERGAGPLASLKSLMHGHFGWFFRADSTHPTGWESLVGDLYRKRNALFFQMNYLPWPLLGLALPALAGWAMRGDLMGFVLGGLWGGLVRIFLANHGYWLVNSACHRWGKRPFNLAGDRSGNIPWLALPTMGESWHNNHHAFPNAAKLQFRRFQLDPGGWFIAALELLGLAWDVNSPDREAVDRRRARLDAEPAKAGGAS